MRYILLLFITLFIVACNQNQMEDEVAPEYELQSHPPHGVYYEVFVRAFADSNGDGIGDIIGMTDKLDYLVDLGIEGIWLMPINPSPSYHGYDVTDYKEINPEYGTMEEFKAFVAEANSRGIKVLVDFVVNHTSIEHPWFQQALEGNETYRDYFVWADEETNVRQRGEWSQRVWHEVDGQVYEGVFWDQMPDLNFDNEDVRNEIYEIGRFWLEEVGVDGFRLDAAKHIYSSYHGPDYQEKNHQFWREFRSEMEQVNQDVLLVGEVWDRDVIVAPYLDEGLHSAFNFDLAENILNAARQERDTRISIGLEQTREYFYTEADSFINSTFITNHDMNRVMSELTGNVERAKMAASLLLTLPGNPFIYYGEEIGMRGMKPDEDIRLPMRWYEDPTGTEQTTWRMDNHNNVAGISVEAQYDEEDSLLNHYKELIQARRGHPALIKGEIESISYRESGVVLFKRVLGNDVLFVIHNMTNETKEIMVEDIAHSLTTLYFSSSPVKRTNNTLTLQPYTTLIYEE